MRAGQGFEVPEARSSFQAEPDTAIQTVTLQWQEVLFHHGVFMILRLATANENRGGVCWHNR